MNPPTWFLNVKVPVLVIWNNLFVNLLVIVWPKKKLCHSSMNVNAPCGSDDIFILTYWSWVPRFHFNIHPEYVEDVGYDLFLAVFSSTTCVPTICIIKDGVFIKYYWCNDLHFAVGTGRTFEEEPPDVNHNSSTAIRLAVALTQWLCNMNRIVHYPHLLT